MRKRNLTDEQRQAIWEILLCKRRDDNPNQLIPSAAREIGLQFGVAPTAIRDLFKQTLQHQVEQKTIGDLIAATCKAFEDLDDVKLNNIFLALQLCMMETLKNDGSNRYKVPHMGKGALIRRGMLPESIMCPDVTIQRANDFLATQNE